METIQKPKTIDQYLTFGMNGENYAIPVAHILEVLLVPNVMPIPKMPEFMRGVINIRGSVVPVLDLRLKFGLGKTEMGKSTAIIVIEIPADKNDAEGTVLHLGIFADDVNKVISLNSGELEPPPRIGTKIRTSFILGMGHIDDSFIVILDIKEMLSDDDLALMDPDTVQDKIQKI